MSVCPIDVEFITLVIKSLIYLARGDLINCNNLMFNFTSSRQ